MDRRYILIIFIIFACCCNLYLVSEYSNVVGTASTNFKEITFSLPPNFDVSSTNDRYVQIFNPDFGYITISYSDVDKAAKYEDRLKLLNNNSNVTILSEGSINYKYMDINSVYFKNIDSNGVLNNQSAFYFTKDNFVFRVEMNTFDSDNQNSTIEYLKFIIDSIRYNYKLSK